MGDRTSVTLTVLEDRAAEALSILDDKPEYMSKGSNGFVSFDFHEVNYGNLWGLDALRDAGIAFDSAWASGDGFTSGIHWCRFTPEGECREKGLSDDERNPPLDQLMKLIDDPKGLRGYIQQYHYDVTPPSWENQNEYGKLFRTKQLISK